MSGDTGTGRTGLGTVREDPWTVDRRWLVPLLAALALALAGGRTLLTVLSNLPFEPVAVPPDVGTTATGATTVAAGLTFVAIALRTDRPAVRVGALSVGVFGVLSVFGPGARLPAAVAVIVGTLLVLLDRGRPRTYRAGRRRVVGFALLAGTALALGSGVGLLDAGLRRPGTLLVATAVAAAALRAEGDRVALLAGGLAFGVALWAGLAAPFVLGSALLVGFAVVGVPSLLVAAGVGGAVTAAVAGLRRGEYALAAGAGLLVLAGAPLTVDRAVVLVLGAVLVAGLVPPEEVAP